MEDQLQLMFLHTQGAKNVKELITKLKIAMQQRHALSAGHPASRCYQKDDNHPISSNEQSSSNEQNHQDYYHQRKDKGKVHITEYEDEDEDNQQTHFVSYDSNIY